MVSRVQLVCPAFLYPPPPRALLTVCVDSQSCLQRPPALFCHLSFPLAPVNSSLWSLPRACATRCFFFFRPLFSTHHTHPLICPPPPPACIVPGCNTGCITLLAGEGRGTRTVSHWCATPVRDRISFVASRAGPCAPGILCALFTPFENKSPPPHCVLCVCRRCKICVRLLSLQLLVADPPVRWLSHRTTSHSTTPPPVRVKMTQPIPLATWLLCRGAPPPLSPPPDKVSFPFSPGPVAVVPSC